MAKRSAHTLPTHANINPAPNKGDSCTGYSKRRPKGCIKKQQSSPYKSLHLQNEALAAAGKNRAFYSIGQMHQFEHENCTAKINSRKLNIYEPDTSTQTGKRQQH